MVKLPHAARTDCLRWNQRSFRTFSRQELSGGGSRGTSGARRRLGADQYLHLGLWPHPGDDLRHSGRGFPHSRRLDPRAGAFRGQHIGIFFSRRHQDLGRLALGFLPAPCIAPGARGTEARDGPAAFWPPSSKSSPTAAPAPCSSPTNSTPIAGRVCSAKPCSPPCGRRVSYRIHSWLNSAPSSSKSPPRPRLDCGQPTMR